MSYKVIIADGSPFGQKAVELALPAPDFSMNAEANQFPPSMSAIRTAACARSRSIATACAEAHPTARPARPSASPKPAQAAWTRRRGI